MPRVPSGGSTQTVERFTWASCASAGASSDSSPMPASSSSNSVSCACGQSPPGSSRSSSAKPLASTGPAISSAGRSLARQIGAPPEEKSEKKAVAARMCVLLETIRVGQLRTSDRRPDHSDGNALDRKRIALQVDDDRREVRVLCNQFGARALHLQALHGDVVAEARDDDL